MTIKRNLRLNLGILITAIALGNIPISHAQAIKSYADKKPTNTSATNISVLFGSYDEKTKLVVEAVKSAKQSILVQTASTANPLITKALIDAADRGINISIIMSRFTERSIFRRAPFYGVPYFIIPEIKTYINDQYELTKSNVIVIDGTEVVTGTFSLSDEKDFETKSDLMIITGPPSLVKSYRDDVQSSIARSHVSFVSTKYAEASDSDKKQMVKDFAAVLQIRSENSTSKDEPTGQSLDPSKVKFPKIQLPSEVDINSLNRRGIAVTWIIDEAGKSTSCRILRSSGNETVDKLVIAMISAPNYPITFDDNHPVKFSMTRLFQLSELFNINQP